MVLLLEFSQLARWQRPEPRQLMPRAEVVVGWRNGRRRVGRVRREERIVGQGGVDMGGVLREEEVEVDMLFLGFLRC